MSSEVLKYIRNSEQILTVEKPDLYTSYVKLLILDSATLTVLHRLPSVPSLRISDCIPMFSLCETKLAFVMWKRTNVVIKSTNVQRTLPYVDKQANPLNVVIYRIGRKEINLKRLCSAIILGQTSQKGRTMLPLPELLKTELSNIVTF